MNREPSREILDSILLVPSLRARLGSSLESMPEGDQAILELLQHNGETIRDCMNSFLPQERRLEILEALTIDAKEAAVWQKDAEKREAGRGPVSVEHLRKALWATIATTPPVMLEFESSEEAQIKLSQLERSGASYEIQNQEDGHVLITIFGCRTSFAFYKPPCAYRKAQKSGCRFCMLSGRNKGIQSVESTNQIAALEDALARTALDKRTVVEILPDGSFLNPIEVPEETQRLMISRLAEEEGIYKAAIETRPEYCMPDRVKNLLDVLRSDQKLEIYFGLETTDEFIGAVIHKKGYGFEEFKKTVLTLKEALSEKERKKLLISVYNIIKPIYLTEQESIEASIKMAEDIDTFSREVGIPIEIKYEPSVISAGSFQDYLFYARGKKGERRFKPLSYLSVAELIARLAEKKLEKRAKFGQRDDIDNFTTVSMVPQLNEENMFSQFDFMVYNAVQRFNTRRDMRGFLLDMRITIEHSPEFEAWEKEMYGEDGKSALSRLLATEFQESPVTEGESKREDFQKLIWQVCDEIEYSQDLSETLRQDGIQVQDEIKRKVEGFFNARGITVFKIRDLIFVDIGFQDTPRLTLANTNPQFKKSSIKASFQIEIIILNEEGFPQSIWVKIPLVANSLPQKPNFIY